MRFQGPNTKFGVREIHFKLLEQAKAKEALRKLQKHPLDNLQNVFSIEDGLRRQRSIGQTYASTNKNQSLDFAKSNQEGVLEMWSWQIHSI